MFQQDHPNLQQRRHGYWSLELSSSAIRCLIPRALSQPTWSWFDWYWCKNVQYMISLELSEGHSYLKGIPQTTKWPNLYVSFLFIRFCVLIENHAEKSSAPTMVGPTHPTTQWKPYLFPFCSFYYRPCVTSMWLVSVARPKLPSHPVFISCCAKMPLYWNGCLGGAMPFFFRVSTEVG